MPRVRKVLNGFTASEVCRISRISAPMLEYLRRHDFLSPGHVGGDDRRQGRVRFYSYRDLVVAKLIQRLRESGVRLHLLKQAVAEMARDEFWPDGVSPADGLKWVVSDGKSVLLKDEDGFLDEITGPGQRSFAFVVNVERLRAEVEGEALKTRSGPFTMRSEELVYATPRNPIEAARLESYIAVMKARQS